MKETTTTRAEVANASITVLIATSIRDKSKSKRLPNISINTGADKKRKILPMAPTRNKKLTILGSKNCPNREEFKNKIAPKLSAKKKLATKIGTNRIILLISLGSPSVFWRCAERGIAKHLRLQHS